MQTQSPSQASMQEIEEPKRIPTVKRISFQNAIKAVRDGHTISKVEWVEVGEPECVGELRDGRLKIFRHDEWHPWIISDGDLMGEDFFVVK